MPIRPRLVCAPLAVLALATMIDMAPAQPRAEAQTAEQAAILGPAILPPRSADRACGTSRAGLAPWDAQQIRQNLSLTEDQVAKLNALKDASKNAERYLAESCPKNEPATPTAGLDTSEQRLEAMLEAVREVKPALDDFYQSLTDEQKAHFNGMMSTALTDRAEDGSQQASHRMARRRYGFRLPFRFPFRF